MMFSKSKPLFDWGIALRSLALLLVLYIPFSYLHELGHAAICSIDGFRYDISVMYSGVAMTVCHGDVLNPILFSAFGGIVSSVVAGIPLLFSKIRARKYFLIVLLSFVIGHGLNAIVEASVTESYLGDVSAWVGAIGAVNGLVFIGLVFKFAKPKSVVS